MGQKEAEQRECHTSENVLDHLESCGNTAPPPVMLLHDITVRPVGLHAVLF